VLVRPSRRRLPLALGAGLVFVAALAISWTEGADHLALQALAMVLALLAFLLAAVAARSGSGGSAH
jgi:hypothetical protein